MGSVYFNQGLYSKAMECFAKALQIQQQFLDENNPDLATTYNNIGNVFFTQKKYDPALQYHLKALDIWSKCYGTNSDAAAYALKNVGEIYLEQGNYTEAFNCLKKALDIYYAIDKNSSYVELISTEIGMVYNLAGESGITLAGYPALMKQYPSLFDKNGKRASYPLFIF